MDIESIAEIAALFYRDGIKFQAAVGKALDQCRVHDPVERTAIYREICSLLGKRKHKKKKIEGTEASLPFFTGRSEAKERRKR